MRMATRAIRTGEAGGPLVTPLVPTLTRRRGTHGIGLSGTLMTTLDVRYYVAQLGCLPWLREVRAAELEAWVPAKSPKARGLSRCMQQQYRRGNRDPEGRNEAAESSK